ncbi:MAG: LytTR family DNA-binding domain-containing protein, partial [Bacteroidota bacterium]
QRITTLQSLRYMESKLPKDQFLRVHRSYLVALNKIKTVEGNQIWIGEIKVPVSKSHRKVLSQLLEDYNL